MGRKSNKNKQKIQQKVAENSKNLTPKIEENVEENSKKLTPNSDEKVSENSDIELLRTIDESIEDFLLKADDVGLYEYDEKARDWIQKGVRGGLYLVKRTIDPQYQLIVFNGQDQGKFVENIEDMEIDGHHLSLFYGSKASNKQYWIRFNSSPEFYINRIFNLSSLRGSQPKDQTTRSESKHEKGGAQSSSIAEVLLPQVPPVRYPSFWKFIRAVVNIARNLSTNSDLPLHNHFSNSTSTTAAASPSGILSPSRFVIPDSSATTEKDDNSNRGSRKGINSVDNASQLVLPLTTTSPSLVRTNTLSHEPIISKDQIRSALQNLIQEDAFISMFSDALEKAMESGDDSSQILHI